MSEWPYMDTPSDELRVVRFRPAFHRCDPNPSKDYGIGGVRMLWVLRVNDWAMTWDVSTDWGLPDEAFRAARPDCKHPSHRNGYPRMHRGASGGAVDWHSPVPLWEDSEQPSQLCCPITNAPCYLDTGFILGDDLFDLLREDGDEAVWMKLRELMEDRRSEVASRQGS